MPRRKLSTPVFGYNSQNRRVLIRGELFCDIFQSCNFNLPLLLVYGPEYCRHYLHPFYKNDCLSKLNFVSLLTFYSIIYLAQRTFSHDFFNYLNLIHTEQVKNVYRHLGTPCLSSDFFILVKIFRTPVCRIQESNDIHGIPL